MNWFKRTDSSIGLFKRSYEKLRTRYGTIAGAWWVACLLGLLGLAIPANLLLKVAFVVSPLILYAFLTTALFLKCFLSAKTTTRGLLVERIVRTLSLETGDGPEDHTRLHVSSSYAVLNCTGSTLDALPPIAVSSRARISNRELSCIVTSPPSGMSVKPDYNVTTSDLWRIDRTAKSSKGYYWEVGCRAVPALESGQRLEYRVILDYATAMNFLSEPQQFSFMSHYERLSELNELRVKGGLRIQLLDWEVLDLMGEPVRAEAKRISPPGVSEDATRLSWEVTRAVVGYTYTCHFRLVEL